MNLRNRSFCLLALFFTTLSFNGCDSSEDPVKNFMISTFGSQNVATMTSLIKIGTADYTDYTVSDLFVTESAINLTVERNGFQQMTFKLRPKDGSYQVSSDYAEDKIQFYPQGQSNVKVTGSGALSNFKLDLLDESRGKVSFKLTGNTTFTFTGVTSTTSYPVNFDLNVTFDNKTDPPAATSGSTTGGTGTGGTGSGTGGSGTGSCFNNVTVLSAVSYSSFFNGKWEFNKAFSGTGKKVGAGTNNSNDIALVIDASNTSKGVAYQVQILIPQSAIVKGKRDFYDNNKTAGVLEGVVGVFVVRDPDINDSWRTNRDFGSLKDTGDFEILTIVTSGGKTTLTGTYSFEAYGDGYDGVNNKQKANVRGQFCVTY